MIIYLFIFAFSGLLHYLVIEVLHSFTFVSINHNGTQHALLYF